MFVIGVQTYFKRDFRNRIRPMNDLVSEALSCACNQNIFLSNISIFDE